MIPLGFGTATFALASLLGVFSHLVYFIHGEHHTLGVTYIQAIFTLYVISCLGISSLQDSTLIHSAKLVTLVLGAYLGSLFTSVLVYRAFFHRLRHFPGPPRAKLGKLWHSLQITHGDGYIKLNEWHNQYGEFVRIGSDEISTTHPDALQAILAPKSPCIKPPFYDIDYPLSSLRMTRDPVLHDKRRKVWDQGLSIKSLREYQARITTLADLLADQLSAFGGEAVNATRWFTYFGFDVMAAVAFNTSFNMLRDGKEHFAIKMLNVGLSEAAILAPVFWLINIVLRSPLPSKLASFKDWCKQQSDLRRKNGAASSDIVSHLLTADPLSDTHWINEGWLAGDSRLIVVAGADTTSATLTYMMYHIASDISQQQELRSELAGFTLDESFDAQTLASSERLNAVINETLRLHPPVPSGTSRKTPKEGLTIGGMFIPGECIITVPFWTVHRNPKAWARPHEFIPERWFSNTELILNKDAYAPFSLGKHSCVGKALALMELRIATTILLTRFDIRLAPNEDGADLLERSRDRITVAPGNLQLVFEKIC